MAGLMRIGLLFGAFTLVAFLVQTANADGKKKRVIVKVPSRIKHVYHHHTKKVHIYKKKPKTHATSVHVVHEEESRPYVWGAPAEWNGSGGKKSKNKYSYSDEKHIHRGYSGDFGPDYGDDEYDNYRYGRDDDDYRNHDDYESWHEHKESRKKGKRGTTVRKSTKNSKGKLKGIGEDLYKEEHSHATQYREERKQPRKKPTKIVQVRIRPKVKEPREEVKPKRGSKSPKDDYYARPEDYDDLYDRGSMWPEKKEHPSWHEKRNTKTPKSTKHLYPPQVTEEIEHDHPPKHYYEDSYYPEYKKPSHYRDEWAPVEEMKYTRPYRSPIASGYHRQIARNPDGMSVGYRSHVGHSDGDGAPSSSYQSVTFGDRLKR